MWNGCVLWILIASFIESFILQIVVSANAIGLKHKQLNNWISRETMRLEQLTQVKQKWLSVGEWANDRMDKIHI